MREGWEIKKLGEVCEVLDHLRVPITKKDRREGLYPYYGASGVQDYIDNYIFDGRYLLVGEDGAKWGANDKSAYIIEGKCWVNNHAHVLKINDGLSDRLVEYYLVSKDLQKYITGAIVPKLTQQALRNIPIPIPPLPLQEKIVSELDLLSGVIEKKRQQLKELDNLAQSIFYDMFGDPITNEMGWEVKKLGEVCKLKAGKSIKASELSEEYIDGLYPCYGGNGIRGYIQKNSHEGTLPIIGRQGALCGNVVLARNEFYATEHAVVCTPIITIDNIWLYWALLFCKLNRFAQGVAQPGISVGIINEMYLPLPPLPLQQSFAAKVEAIEQQKALIKQSLAETETLFNSRMEYYFGEE